MARAVPVAVGAVTAAVGAVTAVAVGVVPAAVGVVPAVGAVREAAARLAAVLPVAAEQDEDSKAAFAAFFNMVKKQ